MIYQLKCFINATSDCLQWQDPGFPLWRPSTMQGDTNCGHGHVVDFMKTGESRPLCGWLGGAPATIGYLSN